MSAIPILEGAAALSFIRKVRETAATDEQARTAVDPILADVRARGDRALHELTLEFDGVRVESFRVADAVRRAALRDLDPARRQALEHARDRIERYHRAQIRREPPVEMEAGTTIWREFRPIERVGIYVPGGRADYPSTLLMCGVPARLAGCVRIVACSPPGPGGRPPASVLAAAELVGIDEVYAVGGAQAIAALAYGTESVPRVDKIFGPGNRFVTAAKERLYGAVDIDMPAGPSEIVVLADETANPAWIAADLLSQAEHAPDALAVGIFIGGELAEPVAREIERQLRELRAPEPAASSLGASALCVAPNSATAREWIDRLAPEHLQITTRDPTADLAGIRHAGAVFLGPHAPVAAGDYASGSNHVLPTGGRARAWGGLSLDDFGRWMSVQRIGPAGLAEIAGTVVTLARWEGLEAHARAIEIRDPMLDRREPMAARTAPAGIGPTRGAAARVRPHIRSLEPYTAARDLYGRWDGDRLFLDANESPESPAIAGFPTDLNRYPDPRCGELRAALAGWLEVSEDRLWIGNGSDEAIELLLRAFVEPGEPVLTIAPTYGMYTIAARAHGAVVREVPLDPEFDVDTAATLERAGGARLIFLCSPNNPTGNRLSPERIEEICRSCDALVIVDEAYVEFSRAPSLVPRSREHSNLVLLRTFSKAWGLAGARVGYFVSDPQVVEYVDRINLPYPLSTPAAEAAIRALADPAAVRRARDRAIAERERMAGRLTELGLDVFPSDANFLLVRVPGAREIQRRLVEEHGIVVRDRSGLPHLEDTLRITVGRPEDTDRVCAALEEIVR